MTLKLVGVGGLGLMLSPAAKHLQSGSPARFLRIHDRGTRDARRDTCREAWKNHGAELVPDLASLIGDGDFDGVVVCAGKNGDDLDILRSLLAIISRSCSKPPFILHLSTVSTRFVEAATAALSTSGISYVNYPLTGGPAGAEAGTMLILASGDPDLYAKLEPTLQTIGRPKFFSERNAAGAEVKLIGQLMVFNGLMGISSAAALKSACFQESLSGEAQADFFDFLNGGAGGTRQWDVALSKGIRDNIWDQGFMLQHAVVDAIYAAELVRERSVSTLAVLPMITTALAFAYLLRKHPDQPLATHALVRELTAGQAPDLDAFLGERLAFSAPGRSLEMAIEALPPRVRDSVLLDVSEESFQADL